MRARRIDPDVRRAAEELFVIGYTPTGALRRLERDPALRPRLPSLRTLQDMRAELHAPGSETWTVGAASTEEAVAVLPVLADLVDAGELTSLTRETARWIATVRRIAPDMRTLEVLSFAARYQGAAARGEPTYAIDADLAREMAKRPPG